MIFFDNFRDVNIQILVMNLNLSLNMSLNLFKHRNYTVIMTKALMQIV